MSFTELVRGLLADQFVNHRHRLIIGFIALISVDFLQLSIPLLVKKAIDSLAARDATMTGLFSLAGAILAIALSVVALRFVWRMLIIGFSRYLERHLRNRIFSHILSMDQYFFSRRSTGDIMAHGSNDLAAVQMACGMGMVAAVDALVLSVAAIGFMIYIHPTLTLFALLPLPFLALTTRFLSAKLHRRFNQVQEEFAHLTEFARSAVVSVRLIKAYTHEKSQVEDFDQLGRGYVHANIRVALIQGLLFPVSTLIGNIGLLIVLVYGGRLVIDQQITIGDFAAFTTYLQMLIWPMMAVGWVANLTQRGVTALRRIHGLVTSEPILIDSSTASSVLPSTSGFKASNLDFSYPDSARTQLSGINFDVKSGIIGIAGRTGSGKTTLCKLLVRLYPLDRQALFYGGRDVNEIPYELLRTQIAYVGQEPILFSDTISANIGFGIDEPSMEKIEEAARDAGIHHEIVSFSNGYDTVIGERGITLSGGQRQRIALARALMFDRPVLVIDDGLSAVDTATEDIIVSALRHRFAGRTVFIVSNRLKLLSMTDRILILEEGKLVDDDEHHALLESNAFYQAMHLKQMQENEGMSHA
ncbi:MAG: ABC transporter ATP-binding protein [Desulfofustis sp.]|nr:ABC transporter ATP-binding protein [Desulfofustis sp.]NNK57387.1 ABC transporter ATP-binding protein [Desulfofustis sp.]